MKFYYTRLPFADHLKSGCTLFGLAESCSTIQSMVALADTSVPYGSAPVVDVVNLRVFNVLFTNHTEQLP
jgi:hypothetical protein